jgi:uncharacterized protein (DUF433 family)
MYRMDWGFVYGSIPSSHYDAAVDARVEINPAICGGRPIISGTRITVQTILEFLDAGDSTDDILEAYPTLTKADIEAASRYTARG